MTSSQELQYNQNLLNQGIINTEIVKYVFHLGNFGEIKPSSSSCGRKELFQALSSKISLYELGQDPSIPAVNSVLVLRRRLITNRFSQKRNSRNIKTLISSSMCSSIGMIQKHSRHQSSHFATLLVTKVILNFCLTICVLFYLFGWLFEDFELTNLFTHYLL